MSFQNRIFIILRKYDFAKYCKLIKFEANEYLFNVCQFIIILLGSFNSVFEVSWNPKSSTSTSRRHQACLQQKLFLLASLSNFYANFYDIPLFSFRFFKTPPLYANFKQNNQSEISINQKKQ